MAESFHIDADLTGAGDFFDASGLNLGETYTFSVPGTVTHIRFRTSATLGAGTYVGALYQVTDDDPPIGGGTGTLLGQAMFAGMVADAWNLVALPAPVAVTPGVSYRSTVFSSEGRYRARGAFFAAAAITRGSITGIRDNSVVGPFTLRNATFQPGGALTYPRDTFNAAAYFVDLVFVPDATDLTLDTQPTGPVPGGGPAVVTLGRQLTGQAAAPAPSGATATFTTGHALAAQAPAPTGGGSTAVFSFPVRLAASAGGPAPAGATAQLPSLEPTPPDTPPELAGRVEVLGLSGGVDVLGASGTVEII